MKNKIIGYFVSVGIGVEFNLLTNEFVRYPKLNICENNMKSLSSLCIFTLCAIHYQKACPHYNIFVLNNIFDRFVDIDFH